MKKNTKGTYGYLDRQKRRESLKTVILFGISFLIFLMGFLSTGTKNNLLTIVAVLGCLPASKSAVGMIMYLRSRGCSQDAYEKIHQSAPDADVLYDLYLTSYDKNYQISSLAVRGNTVCGFTEDAACDVNGAQKHIGSILQQNGFKNMTVKVFGDLEKYVERLRQLDGSGMETDEKQGELTSLLCDVSL